MRLFTCLLTALLFSSALPLKANSGPEPFSFVEFEQLEGSLEISGGTAHIPVMKEAARNIMRSNPKISISVGGGGSAIGIQKAGLGLADIGNSGRSLTDEEQKIYKLTSIPFAIDGIAIVVHPSNSVKKLTSQQVKEIYAGVIVNWNEVGGKDSPIQLYSREDASGTREVFSDIIMKKAPLADSANIVTSNGSMKIAVMNDPQGIGYISIGHLDESLQPVAIDNVAPTQENALSGTYSVTRFLYMNIGQAPSPLRDKFIQYLSSDEGNEIIRRHGYLPITK